MVTTAQVLKAVGLSARTLSIGLALTAITAPAQQILGPVVQKAFVVPSIAVGMQTALTFTISNPNPATTLTDVKFTDTLPAGLVIGNPASISGFGCSVGSTISVGGVTGGNAITLTATLGPNGSCFFGANVQGITPGTKVNAVTIDAAGVEGGRIGGNTSTATLIVVGGSFQVTYASNLTFGESYINMTNNGANGAALLGPGFGTPVGNICVNLYAFSPDEQLISCCSCLITPNGLANVGAIRDLTSKTLTGVVPTSIVVKTLTTLAGGNGSGTSCSNSAAAVTGTALVDGLVAWRTTIHPGASGGYQTTEVPFSQSNLSNGELASIVGRCASILGNGSGFGICKSCQAGGLGAERM